MALKKLVQTKKIRPPKNSLERFRRTSRYSPAIMDRAIHLKGPALTKVTKVANIVLERIPIDWGLCAGKTRLFKRNANSAILKRKPVGYLHCAERCNLALSLLNASGVKSWLARELILTKNQEGKYKWHFHDYVEFFANGKVHTLVFHAYRPIIDTYAVFEGPTEKISPGEKNSFVFRGADSKQIGGVGSWEEYEKFSKKLDWDPKKEVSKNQRRLSLLTREGVIPKEAFEEITLQ